MSTAGEGAWGDVELRRAESGMPLLSAGTEAAAFYGLGYAQASDDLDGLLRQYLLARGELSLAEGEAARERDRNQARWRVAERSRAAFAALPEPMRQCYRAFIAGVAARVAEVSEQAPEQVPVWAPALEPWLPIGVNATVTLFWTIADAATALRAAGVELPPVVSELDRTPMVPGSNAWVIFPERTADGASYLVSDPHLPFGGVHAMHEAAIVTPTLHYTGFTFLGAMLPALAHNADVAWGVTTGGPRVSDAYRVVDTGQDAETLNGLWSPIIARRDGWAYAICTPYVDLLAETEQQFLAMLRAEDVDQLRGELERLAFPPQNFLAVDRNGDGFSLRIGRVPRRPAGASGVLEPEQAWEDGFLDLDELVHIERPAAGFLQNCNSSPDTVAAELRVQDWSPDAFNDAAGRQTSRSERSIELLANSAPITLEDVLAWAVDDYWPDTAPWREALSSAASAAPERIARLSEERRALLASLVGFDGHASPDSVAASGWLNWRRTIADTPVDPVRLRERVDARDADLLLTALENCPLESRPYGEVHRFASGAAGRGGAFTVRPSAPGDVQPSMQAPLRVTYFADGIAVGGGPALRVVRFDAEGDMRSWSLLLPARADVFATGGVLPTAFVAASAPLVRTLRAEES